MAWPALLTLLVTILRLVGELRRWPPEYFSRLPGGGLAIVGITWLVPLVGLYFGFRLVRAGVGAPDAGRGAGWPAAALVGGLLLGYFLERLLQPSWNGTLVLWALVAAAVGTLSYAAWPELGKPLLLYALAARLPVAVIMAVAIRSGWGTHYDAVPPGYPGTRATRIWLWTGLLPQSTIWIAFTLAVGALGAAAGARLANLRRE